MRNNSTFRLAAALAAAGCIASVSCGCGGGGGGGGTTTPPVTPPISQGLYVGTQAPGDAWDWLVGDGIYTASNITKGTTYTGAVTALPSGFYKLAVSTSTDSTAPAGSAAYAFLAPNAAMVTEAAGGDTNPVFSAAETSNPVGTTTYDYVAIPPTTWSSTTGAAYGTATLAMGSGNQGQATFTNYLLNGTSLGSASDTVTLTNGAFTNGSSTGLVSPAGLFSISNGATTGGVMGVLSSATNVNTVAVASNQFRGTLYKSGSSGSSTELVQAVPASGKLTVTGYSNVETNTLNPSTAVTVAFTSQPKPGLIDGTVKSGSTSVSFVFAVSQVGGDYILLGFGYDTTNKTAENLILIQK